VYPNIPAGFGLARVHHTTGGGNGHAFSIFGFAPGAAAAHPAVENAVMTHWTTRVMPLVSNKMTCDTVQCVVNIGGVVTEGNSTNAPVVGGDLSQPLAWSSAVVIRKNTGTLGKHFRGRFYIPGVPTGAVDGTTVNLTAGRLTTWQTAFTALVADFAADTALNNLVLLHRSVAIAPTVISSLTVEGLLGNQRRRQRKAAHR
jgi:hypothetical protein